MLPLSIFYGLIDHMDNTLSVCLFHWNDAEASERLDWLRQAGFSAYHLTGNWPLMRNQLSEHPPRAIVIDLSRLPSHGREVGAALRATKATHSIPLVFVSGQPDKVARVRALLPDAVFTTWEEIGPALRAAIAHPPKHPIRLKSSMDAYAGQPVLKKLGIKPGMIIGAWSAPPDLTDILGDLPDGTRLEGWNRQAVDILLWFVRTQSILEEGMPIISQQSDLRTMWIVWPKKGSALHAGLTQRIIRKIGLGAGWVDHKICSLDATWSALLFSRRK